MKLTIDTAKADATKVKGWAKPSTKAKQAEDREARILAHIKTPDEVLKERGHKS